MVFFFFFFVLFSFFLIFINLLLLFLIYCYLKLSTNMRTIEQIRNDVFRSTFFFYFIFIRAKIFVYYTRSFFDCFDRIRLFSCLEGLKESVITLKTCQLFLFFKLLKIYWQYSQNMVFIFAFISDALIIFVCLSGYHSNSF